MLLPSLILLASLYVTQTKAEDFTKKGPAVMMKQEFKNSGKMAENARTYREMVQISDRFMDKSHFIAAWQKGSGMISELRCPPKWGKTITLHMMKNFFEIELYENWTRIPKEESLNYRLFRKKEIVRENGEVDTLVDELNINVQDHIMHRLGNYPVILLSFENITAASYKEFFDQVGEIFSDLFKQFGYLEGILDEVEDVEIFYNEADAATNEAKYEDESDYNEESADHMSRPANKVVMPESESSSDKFRKILERRATAAELTSAIHLLSKLLQKYFSKNVYLFVDDYDCIFKIFFTNKISEDDQQNISKFYLSLLLNSLQYNQYLEKSLIMGTYDAKGLLRGFDLSLFNTSINILHHPCGFSRFDVERMLRFFPIESEASKKTRQWFNGYRTGRRLSINMHEVPPLISFFNSDNFTLYDMSHMMDDFVRKSIQVKRFRGILANSITGKTYLKYYLYKDESQILQLKNITLTPDLEVDDNTRDLYLTLLLVGGYFTTRMNGTEMIVQIPNHRMKHKLAEMLMDYYKIKYNIKQHLIDDVTAEMYNFMENDTSYGDRFTTSLHKFFGVFPLYNDIFPLHLMRFLFHYFALKISSIYNYRLLEMLVAMVEPMAYFSLYRPERKVIFGIKLSHILTERMVILLHMFENSTTLAPVSNCTKIIGMAIPRHGGFVLHHEILQNF